MENILDDFRKLSFENREVVTRFIRDMNLIQIYRDLSIQAPPPAPPTDNRSPFERAVAVPPRTPARATPARQGQAAKLPTVGDIGRIPFQNIVGYKGVVEEV